MTNDVARYGLGLHFSYDEKSRAYPIRELLTSAPLQNRYWDTYTRLNQGSTPRCVGYGCADELAAVPVPIAGVTNVTGDTIYPLAQRLDEIPGENYDGSTALGGMKALKQMGYIGEYRWAFGIDDVIRTVSEFGPVCLATQWYNSMFTPSPTGQLVINGSTAGGHFYLLDEFELDRGRLWLLNTWGESWGVRGQAGRGGRAWMAAEDVDKLLKQGGTAPVITVRLDPSNPNPPAPPEPPKPIVITPFSYTLPVNTGKVFSASVPVNWFADRGAWTVISPTSVLYGAPASPGNATLTARSMADPTKFSQAPITVTAGPTPVPPVVTKTHQIDVYSDGSYRVVV